MALRRNTPKQLTVINTDGTTSSRSSSSQRVVGGGTSGLSSSDGLTQDQVVELIENLISDNNKSLLTEIGKKFLSKVNSDIAAGKITFKKGLQSIEQVIFGEAFVSGILGGVGGMIDSEGNGELESLVLRGFLQVPELRFNRIDVVSGELWNSIAFGTVLKVDTENCICWLKLEDGERSGVHQNDICRGIFSNFGEGTQSTDTDDCGFTQLYGFSTAYFTPTEILTNEEGEFSFRYALKAGTTVHPCKSMKFAVYGNFTDKTRQASAYSTRTYARYLSGVNTWKVDPDKHIYMQVGNLDGLQIGSVAMKGYGMFGANCYFKGQIIQLTPEQLAQLKGESAYSVNLTGEEGVITVDEDGNLVGGEKASYNVTSDGYNVVTGKWNVVALGYRLQTTIQAFKGSEPLEWGASMAEGKYVVGMKCVGCSAVLTNGILTIVQISDLENCYVSLDINCEGNAVFQKEYKVTAVYNGASPVTADLDNEMDAVACDENGKYIFGLPVSTTFAMYRGAKKLSLDSLSALAPNGVTVTCDKSTGVVRVTEIPDTDDDVFVIQLTGAASCNMVVNGKTEYIQQTKTLLFTLCKQRAGENAVIYQLLPSVSQVKHDKDGVYTPTGVRCVLRYTNGKTAGQITQVPDGYTMKYSTDGSAAVNYTINTDIAVSGKESVEFYLYADSTLIDKETIPVVEDGTDGQVNFTSFVFRRSNTQPSAPTGGTFTQPVPSGWYDSIPDGSEAVWMSKRVFTNDGLSPQESSWSTPRQMTDTADFDVEFCKKEKYTNPPQGHPNTNAEWGNDGTDAVWMATSTCKNGEWGAWVIVKIKGEQGEPGGDGESPAVISVSPGTLVIGQRITGTMEPSSAAFTCYKQVGEAQEVVSPVWSVEYYDGSEWQTYSSDNWTVDAQGAITVQFKSGYLTYCVTANYNGVVAEANVSGNTDGATGVGIKKVEEMYCAYTLGNSEPSWTLFKSTVPTLDDETPYLWNYEIIYYDDNTSTHTDRKCIGYKGKNGDDGDDGVGIASVEEYYLASAKSSGVTNGDSGFVTTFQAVSESKPYLWNYTKVTYTSGDTTKSAAVIIGHYGSNGATGATGAMPRYRGTWDSSVTYSWDSYYRDIVIYDGSAYIVKSFGSVAAGTYPTNTSYWEGATSFSFVAMDTALIDGADIAGFLFKNKIMQSRDTTTVDGSEVPILSLNGQTGEITAYNLNARGSLMAGEEDGKRVEVTTKGTQHGVYIYDEDNVLGTVMDGTVIKTASSVFGDSTGDFTLVNSSGQSTTVTFSATGKSSQQWIAATSAKLLKGSNKITVVVSSATASYTGSNAQLGLPASQSVYLGLVVAAYSSSVMSDDTLVERKFVEGAYCTNTNGSFSGTFSVYYSVSLPDGCYCRIEAEIIANSGQYKTFTGSFAWKLTSASFEAGAFFSRHFRNGMLLSKDASNYFLAIQESAKTYLDCYMVSNGYGLAVTNGAIKTYTEGGSDWKSMPILMYKGHLSYSSSTKTYTPYLYFAFDGKSSSALTVTRSDVGKVTITFPNTVSFSLRSTIIHVLGFTGVGNTDSNGFIYATLRGLATNSITVWLADDEKANDGSFMFDIWNIY